MAELGRLTKDTARRERAPGVTIAVVDHDEIVACAAAGFADLATRKPMRLDGASNWFSMTKIATATTAMMLAESGSLDLQAPVAKYLGDVWPENFGSVRVRDLLSHSSGLGNPLPIRWFHRANDPRPDPATFLARLLAKERRPRFQPGTRAAYSNVGYLALGQVIAVVAGCPYETFVRDELLVPLQMSQTAFAWGDPALTDVPRITAHQRLPRVLTPAVYALLGADVLSARAGKFVTLTPVELDGSAYGGLIGPVTDAARLVALHCNGGKVNQTRLLSARSVREMTTVATQGHPYDVGLGWFRHREAAPPQVEHPGGGVGFWNVLRINPTTAKGAAVMSNTTKRWNIAAFTDTAIELHQ